MSQLLAVEEREGKLDGGDGDECSKAEQTRKQWGNKRVGCSFRLTLRSCTEPKKFRRLTDKSSTGQKSQLQGLKYGR